MQWRGFTSLRTLNWEKRLVPLQNDLRELERFLREVSERLATLTASEPTSSDPRTDKPTNPIALHARTHATVSSENTTAQGGGTDLVTVYPLTWTRGHLWQPSTSSTIPQRIAAHSNQSVDLWQLLNSTLNIIKAHWTKDWRLGIRDTTPTALLSMQAQFDVLATNPLAWWKADADVTYNPSNQVSSWLDQTSNNYDLSRVASGSVTYTASDILINNKPAVRFVDQSGGLGISAVLSLPGAYSMICVARAYQGQGGGLLVLKQGTPGGYPSTMGIPSKSDIGGSTECMFDVTNDLAAQTYYPSPGGVGRFDSQTDTGLPWNSYHVFYMDRDGSNALGGYIDGNYKGTGSRTGTIAAEYVWWKGGDVNPSIRPADFAEIIVWNRQLTSTERDNVVSYLNGKYNLNGGGAGGGAADPLTHWKDLSGTVVGIVDTNVRMGWNTTTPAGRVHVVDTSIPQYRSAYDGSNYIDLDIERYIGTVASTTESDSTARGFNFYDKTNRISTGSGVGLLWNLRATYASGAYDYLQVSPGGFFGFGPSTGTSTVLPGCVLNFMVLTSTLNTIGLTTGLAGNLSGISAIVRHDNVNITINKMAGQFASAVVAVSDATKFTAPTLHGVFAISCVSTLNTTGDYYGKTVVGGRFRLTGNIESLPTAPGADQSVVQFAHLLRGDWAHASAIWADCINVSAAIGSVPTKYPSILSSARIPISSIGYSTSSGTPKGIIWGLYGDDPNLNPSILMYPWLHGYARIPYPRRTDGTGVWAIQEWYEPWPNTSTLRAAGSTRAALGKISVSSGSASVSGTNPAETGIGRVTVTSGSPTVTGVTAGTGTGTIKVTAGSPTVDGLSSSTIFTTELAIGYDITVTDTAETYTILSITDNDTLTLTANVTTGDSDSTFTYNTKPSFDTQMLANDTITITSTSETRTIQSVGGPATLTVTSNFSTSTTSPSAFTFNAPACTFKSVFAPGMVLIVDDTGESAVVKSVTSDTALVLVRNIVTTDTLSRFSYAPLMQKGRVYFDDGTNFRAGLHEDLGSGYRWILSATESSGVYTVPEDLTLGAASTNVFTFNGRAKLRLLAGDPLSGGGQAGTRREVAVYNDVLYLKTVGDGTDTNWTAAGGVTDHGALSGLLDDDHTQYLLADGSRAVSGSMTLGDDATDVYTFTGRAKLRLLPGDPLSGGGQAGTRREVAVYNDALYLKTVGDGTDTNWVTTSGVTDHGGLTGLGDDDHTQYLLVTGGRDVTGSMTLGDASTDVYTFTGRAKLRLLAGDPLSGGGQAGTRREIAVYNDKLYLKTVGDGTDTNWLISGYTDHGDLGGRGDDDHTQYLLADGSRTVTGSMTLGDASTDVYTFTGRMKVRDLGSDPRANDIAGTQRELATYNDRLFIKASQDGTEKRWLPAGGVMFTQYSDGEATSTLADDSWVGTGVGAMSIAPGVIKQGTVIRIKAFGTVTCPNATRTLRLKMKIGTSVPASTEMTNFSYSPGNVTNHPWWGEWNLVAVDASGGLRASAFYFDLGASTIVDAIIGEVDTATTDYGDPSTDTLYIDLTGIWNTGTNTFTCRGLTMEIMN